MELGWFSSWLPSRPLPPIAARFGMPGYVVEAPWRRARRRRWVGLGKRCLAGGAAFGAFGAGLVLLLLLLLLGLLLPLWGLSLLVLAGGGAGAWQVAKKIKGQAPGHMAYYLSYIQNDYQQNSMITSAYKWDRYQTHMGYSSSSALDSRTTLPANCTVETNTLGSWNSWVQKDFTPTVAQRHWEAKFHNSPYFSSSTTTSTSSLGSRTTSPAHCMVETNIPGSWISWVMKDFTPTVAQRHWEAADSPYFNSSSSSSSLLDQRSSRLTLTPAESPTPDPCAREMVVQALQEKERPEKRKAEGTDLELNHYGREKRSRYESAESGSSQVPASGGAPASIVPQPGTLDTLPGHKRAFKRKHCSSPLSTSSTESISYGIPQIFKAKGGKKTLKSTHGQDNLSKEPSCSQSSHLENGPHRTMQVKMDVVETPRQEASNLQAPALCPDSPKWMSVSFVRINPNEPSKLTPELEALSEAMKVRAEAEKAARLQQEDHSVCTEQTSQGGAPPSPQPGPSWPAGPDSMPVVFGSGVPLSHEELLPPVTETEVARSGLPQGPDPMPVVFGSGVPLSHEELLPPVTETEVARSGLPQGPDPMPVIFGSGVPLSHEELLPPVTETEVATSGLPQGPDPMPVIFGSGVPLSHEELLPPVTEMEVATSGLPQGPDPMPVIFGSGVPLSHEELLPPVTEMEVATSGLPQGPDPMPVIFGSGVPFSHEELLPPVTEMEVDGPSSSSVAAPQLPSPSATPSSGGGGFVAKTPIKYSRSVLRPATLAAPTPSNRQAQLTPSSGPLQTSAGPTQGPVELGSPFGFPASGSSTSSSSVAAPQLPSPSAAPSSGGGGFVAKTPIKYSRSVLRPATLAAPTPSNRQAQLTPSSGPLQTSAGPTQGPVELGSPFGFPASGSSTSSSSVAAPQLPSPSAAPSSGGGGFVAKTPIKYSRSVLRPATLAAPTPSNRQAQLTPSSGPLQTSAGPTQGPVELGSPFGFPASGSSTSGALQAAYSLPRPSGSFHF
ncbi:nuclear envelope pore membrane protein POM 121-like [Anolis sagrei]|uniref:nuclear envelope pore membrane protein POM 121-like n=1 Tax=Anolis sagrei TaxID=38937 RepID=UPI00351F9871